MRYSNLRKLKRLKSYFTFIMIVLGPVLAVVTYLLLGPLDTGSRGTALRIILMCDLVYVLLIIGLLFQRIMAIIAQRRRKSAGSQLHLRLTGFFTLMSLVPTITVAVFATISINMGFEAWFSDRVQNVIRVSLDAAQAYEFEQKSGLREDAKSLGRRLEQVKAAQRIEDPGAIRQELDRGQQSDGTLRLRGFRSYKFDYEMPPPQAFDLAFEDVHLIRDYENNELRALVSLRGFGDQYLYVTREVDGVLLGLLDQTQQTARLYQQLEQDRDLYLFNFGLLYLAFAVLLIVFKVVRGGRLENLLVRVAPRTFEGGALEGYVIAFDDVTDLVAAQRSAAWGDVARRIAHEIKNPLTPIQLSAERIRRKFSPKLDADADDLDRMTQVIVRQTNDLRRIVDEFSKFARMPEAVKQREDIAAILHQAVTLQQAGQPDVTFHIDIPDQVIPLSLDATMISQALTNLIKNAGEAIDTRIEKGVSLDLKPAIAISLTDQDTQVSITISDNGIGLPQDRAKLFEPYVTTRDKGTGLGLPIVKKIIEEHGGVLRLDDAEPIGGTQHVGAAA
ncbi:MAG: hypothetical protein EBW03_09425, partial [Rhodobacteraceae bacterium]|nr:hypothetical protein [Paracoccaceae bacterium]